MGTVRRPNTWPCRRRRSRRGASRTRRVPLRDVSRGRCRGARGRGGRGRCGDSRSARRRRARSADLLRGKVVVVNVWTFACYNCLNALPHVKALAAKYADQDVVVVGVHTPELARERVPGNVADAVSRLGVTYPVALDANYTVWRAFRNEYWPSVYIADRKGRIRFHHFGEGRYDDEDRIVAQLLSEPR